MSKLTEKRKVRLCDAAFAALFAALALIYAWKAPRGFCSSDEAFYASITYRLWQGDALLSGEWHVSQLVALPEYPYMLLFRLFSPTNDGVYLALRYCYFATLLICGVMVYLLLRRHDGAKRLAALAAAAMLVSHVPFALHTLSYNTLCIISLTLAGVLLVAANGRAWKYAAAGLCYAGAVLCCPYLVLIWAAYSLLLIVKCLKLKKAGEGAGAARILRAWAQFTVGCAVLAGVLAAFVLSRTTPGKIIASLPGIFADPEHASIGLWSKIEKWLYYIFAYDRLMTLTAIATAALLAVWHFDKRREEHKWCYYLPMGVLMLCLLWHLDGKLGLFNMRVNPSMPFLTLAAYIIGGKKEKRMFRFVFLPGLAYSFCVHLGSNTEYACMYLALHVCNVAGAYIITSEAVSLRQGGKRGQRVGACVLGVCVAALIALNVKSVMTTGFSLSGGRIVDDVRTCYSKVETGPCKGLYFTEEEHYDYAALYEQTEAARAAEGESVVYYVPSAPWLYVADEKESASFSGWMSFGSPDVLLERMELYWEINPEKVADVVYVDKNADGWEEALIALNPNNYPVTDLGYAYLIQK